MSETVREGDRVLLYQDPRRKWVATASRTKFHTHKGFVDLESIIGTGYGSCTKTSMGQPIWIFKPRPVDMVEAFDRPTQILYPKDIGYVLYQLGIGPGNMVAEVGTGSGVMTAALARAVNPEGHVYSYETRPDFHEAALKNLERVGVSSLATLHNKDPSQGFEENGLDAVVLDLGDPWTMTRAAWMALKGGGIVTGFTPTFNQLEKLGESLRQEGFLVLESVEVLLREMKTELGKLRPESRMVGHTAYITIARKIVNAKA
ncbi:MAG TPA: tRNA (adenine-N1)-methyltransferase [Candidatus Bathyarchaeia archaeon]